MPAQLAAVGLSQRLKRSMALVELPANIYLNRDAGYMHPLYVEYGYNQGFIGDWSYGFDGCYDLANHPNPLKPYREPETNADSYATLAMGMDSYILVKSRWCVVLP